MDTSLDAVTVPLRVVATRPGPWPRWVGRTVTTVAVLGRFVSMAALLVLAGAVGGLLEGVTADDVPTVVATIGGSGHGS